MISNPLNRRFALPLTLLFAAQAGVVYLLPKEQPKDLVRPLHELPTQFGEWKMQREDPVEPEVLSVLRADATLSRLYARSPRQIASLFIAFFRSQSTGVTPHSPKNCLPGSGWTPSQSGYTSVPIPGRDPIQVNRYIVSKGTSSSLVLYWYQSRDRVVPDEWRARMYLVVDAFRERRSDTSIVRVVVPVPAGREQDAEAAAGSLIQAVFRPITALLPQ